MGGKKRPVSLLRNQRIMYVRKVSENIYGENIYLDRMDREVDISNAQLYTTIVSAMLGSYNDSPFMIVDVVVTIKENGGFCKLIPTRL